MTESAQPRTDGQAAAAILVVDDDEEIVRLLVMLLVAHGHTAVGATSVAEARERYDRADPPTLVVTDVGLADGNGVGLIAELGHPMSRTLFTSGHVREQFDGSAYEVPPLAAFVQKPCTPGSLLAAVQSLLEGTR